MRWPRTTSRAGGAEGGFIPLVFLERVRGEAGLGARLSLYDKGNGIERG